MLRDADREPLHQIRVNLRRLRTVLSVFGPALVLPRGVRAARIASLARCTGETRDLAADHSDVVTRLAAEYDAWFAEVIAEWRAARTRILAHDQAAWQNRTPPDPRQLFRDEWPWSNAPGADPRTADPREVFRGFWSDHP